MRNSKKIQEGTTIIFIGQKNENGIPVPFGTLGKVYSVPEEGSIRVVFEGALPPYYVAPYLYRLQNTTEEDQEYEGLFV